MKIAAEILQDLGWHLNAEKSVTIPTQRMEHLGFVIDSTTMTVTLTEEKTSNLIDSVQALLRKSRPSIRQVAQVVGGLIATRYANRSHLLYTKAMETAKIQALRDNAFNFDKKMDLTDDMKSELTWWLQHLPTLVAPIHLSNFDIEVRTDASLSGWGFFFPESGHRDGGIWGHMTENNTLII